MADADQATEGTGSWDLAVAGDPPDYSQGTLSSLTVVHVQLCWTVLAGGGPPRSIPAAGPCHPGLLARFPVAPLQSGRWLPRAAGCP